MQFIHQVFNKLQANFANSQNLKILFCFNPGEGWTVHLDQLTKLKPFASDHSFQRQFMQVKANNKMKLAQYLEQATGVAINPASMFDIQVPTLVIIVTPSKIISFNQI